ncbi:methyltransferase [Sphingomonas lutea]|uniref:Methyltransferase n=1 Tax=Sphingomonas lutea TaxID=1045317 RepID=A0A7G9SEU3_9SPHN|nr:methyltransferase [Sphingomonas lutea]QNN66368.1 methyltransferase [Sphingomonas lutea]
MLLDEHLEYLSDEVRLQLFCKAIAETVRPGDRVLDLGCGVGILGLLCLKAGAGHVWGIDQTDAIELARETMTRLGLSDRYTCVRERSFRATIPEQVDLIVCDHVGHFGVDYGILDTLGDARRRFLKPGGNILPEGLQLFLAAANAPQCRTKAEEWGQPNIPAEYRWLREHGVNMKHPRTFCADDILSEAAQVGRLDLYQDNSEQLTLEATLRAKRDGVIDGLVSWFECTLSATVSMSNSPFDGNAIKRDQAFLPFERPVAVQAGDALEASVVFRPDTNLLAWTIRLPRTGERHRQSTWHSMIIGPGTLPATRPKVAELSPVGAFRKALLQYVDGVRTTDQIVEDLVRTHPDLFASRDEIRRLAELELSRNIKG